MAWRSPRPAAPISNPLAQLDASRKPEGGWRLLVTHQSREEILVSSATSPNFEFLAAHDPNGRDPEDLVEQARLLRTDNPNLKTVIPAAAARRPHARRCRGRLQSLGPAHHGDQARVP